MHDNAVPVKVTFLMAALYVLSGVTQPLLMTVAKEAGLADPSCQLYMLFYYLGPASIILTLCKSDEKATSWATLLKTSAVAMVDIVAQTMNYTGSTMAGPTIFAIIYASVTIWCAVLSRVMLKRYMSYLQWFGVALVFWGLSIAGFSSKSLGSEVFHGAMLVSVGSALHALMYVLSEAVMNTGEKVSARKYCAIYASFACSGYFLWQVLYTRYHFNDLILSPMQSAGTSPRLAGIILLSIMFASLVHSLTFFHTVKFFPGGATSAGVMKALQAVLVFAATSLVFCGLVGGPEMCFTTNKLFSLVVVVGGLLLYGKATERIEMESMGYRRIDCSDFVELKVSPAGKDDHVADL